MSVPAWHRFFEAFPDRRIQLIDRPIVDRDDGDAVGNVVANQLAHGTSVFVVVFVSFVVPPTVSLAGRAGSAPTLFCVCAACLWFQRPSWRFDDDACGGAVRVQFPVPIDDAPFGRGGAS